MQRTFERSRVDIGNPRLLAFRMVCAACGVQATVNCNKFNQLPDEVVARKFTEKGWLVGNNENNDLCPEHKQRVRMIDKEAETEGKLIDRIATAMHSIEQALERYAKIDRPNRTVELMGLLTDFQHRVFGDGQDDDEEAA